MALRKIRQIGDDLLRKKSKEIKEINKSILTLLDDMKDTLSVQEGVGLAAPQVGVLRRVIVALRGEELFELINPIITESEGEQESNEGCLSIPGKYGKVTRPSRVVVEALDRNGDKITVEGTERFAIILCHEIDHLDGILYVDRTDEVYDMEPDEDEEEETE